MRTSSRARIVLSSMCVLALAAATASAQDVLYFRVGGALSPASPSSGATTALLSMRIPSGEDALLGSFISDPVAHDIVAGEAHAVVFLGTGRPGMDGCARVTTSLTRLAAAQAVVATGTLGTSISPRRKVTGPIVVPMSHADALLAATGDRLVVDVRVANDCGGERTVSLLYDSVGRASRLELVAPGATTTTSTSTSTTTTLPPTCLVTATGLAAVRCRLEAMDEIIRGASPASLGGPRFVTRLERRVDRALTFVRAAELIDATPRRLRKGRRQVVRFQALLARGRATGRVAPDVGDPLVPLATGAGAGLAAMLAGG